MCLCASACAFASVRVCVPFEVCTRRRAVSSCALLVLTVPASLHMSSRVKRTVSLLWWQPPPSGQWRPMPSAGNLHQLGAAVPHLLCAPV